MNKQEYKVSIITVVYNGAATIEYTIRSVLEQTYSNIEYIIIDGGSVDGTQQIVRKYQDSIAYFVSEDDDGIYDAMNKGIRQATGDIIGMINSDDWYADDAVETVVKCFIQKKADVVYGKLVSIRPDGITEVSKRDPLENFWHRMAVLHPTVFVKREMYEKFGYFDFQYKLAADYDLMLRFYSRCAKFEYVDRVIAFFRVGGRGEQGIMRTLEETKSISMNYISECADKESVLKKIEENYRWGVFLEKLKNENGLSDMLEEFYQKKDVELFIFGAGIWGERCCKMLSNSRMRIVCVLDNDVNKWGKKIQNLEIRNPNELRNVEADVLIAVKENGNQIKEQLCMLSHKKTRCISLMDLAMLDVKSMPER